MKTKLPVVILLIVNLYGNAQDMERVELKLTNEESKKAEQEPGSFSFTCQDFYTVFQFKEGDLNTVCKNNVPFTGNITIKYSNDSILTTINWLNGKRDGEELVYYQNGKRRLRVFYTNGKITDEFRQYYENENIELIRTYENGNVNGIYSLYYENGSIRETGMEKQGKTFLSVKKTGQWKYYYENGNIKEEGEWNYTEGGRAKTGEWKYYDENGKLIKTEKNPGIF